MSRAKKVGSLLRLSETLLSDKADVYLFFADLVGSTEYKNSLITLGQPDVFWILRQLIFLERSAKIVRKYNGIVVKTIGDEIFAYFEVLTDPIDILNCGIEVIQGFENLNTYKGKSKIEVKVSIDLGETYNGSIVKSVSFDPIGLPVDRCARLNSKAERNEIAFSNDFLDALSSKKSLADIKKTYNYTSYQEDLKGLGKVKYHRIIAQ